MSRLSVSGKRWLDLCVMVKDRDGWQCTVCGEDQDLTVDHIVPLAAFTEADWLADRQYDSDNLTTLCRRCNGLKSDRAVLRQSWTNRRWFPTVR